MIVKLLTERHLEFRSLKGGSRGSSESTLVKISKCWKFHALTHYYDTEQSSVLRKKIPKNKDNASGFSTLRKHGRWQFFVQRN